MAGIGFELRRMLRKKQKVEPRRKSLLVLRRYSIQPRIMP